jgi:hypothetical protein
MCRVVSLEIIQKERMKQGTLNYYDKDKYREMILDAVETVLKFLDFDRTVYGMPRNNRKKMRWYEELQDETRKDIQTEMMIETNDTN